MKSYLKKQRLLKLANISVVALSLIIPAAYAEDPCQDEVKVYEPTAAIPSDNMQAAYPDKTFKAFGDTAYDKFFGHSFTNLNIPGKTIVGAKLEIKAQPTKSSASTNDTLKLKFFGAGGSSLASGWDTYFGSGNSNPGLLSNQWIIIFYQNSHTFNLDLDSLPNSGGSIINELNTHGFLDFLVEDDTTIESLKLTVKYQCTCIEPPSGMVAWWPLDETSGTNANEIINNNDGTHHGNPNPVSAKVAGALIFDGVDDYIEVPDNYILDFGENKDFSIDAWIRTKGKGGSIQTIVDKRYEDGKKNTKGYTFFLSNGKLGVQLATGNGTWGCGNTANHSCTNYISSGSSGINLGDGNWYHVAVTINRSNAPLGTFYVNGQLDGTFNPILRIGDLSNDKPLTIGRNTNEIVSSNFQGNIDEVEIFKRVLTAEEVKALWFADKHGKCKPEPLSVTLDKFTANAADGKITINWTTGTETNNAGFILWRATPINGQCSTNPSNYKDVRQVKPLVYSKAKDGVLGASYSEEDNNVESGITYCYGLEDIDYDGKRIFHIDQIISATLN